MSLDLDLGPSRLRINAFGEKAPSQILRDRDAGSDFSRRLGHEFPAIRTSRQIPSPTAFAGYFHRYQRSQRHFDIAIQVGQTPYEAIQNRMIQLRCHKSGAVGGQPNLLLMMPAFSQLASGVEPV